jgi:hypothetical protein
LDEAVEVAAAAVAEVLAFDAEEDTIWRGTSPAEAREEVRRRKGSCRGRRERRWDGRRSKPKGEERDPSRGSGAYRGSEDHLESGYNWGGRRLYRSDC